MSKIKEFIKSYILELLCISAAILLIIVKLTTNVYADEIKETNIKLPVITRNIIENIDYSYYVIYRNIKDEKIYMITSNEKLYHFRVSQSTIKDILTLKADSKINRFVLKNDSSDWNQMYGTNSKENEEILNCEEIEIIYSNYSILNSNASVYFSRKLPIYDTYDIDSIERTNLELTSLNATLVAIKQILYIVLLMMLWEKIDSTLRKWVKKC